MSKVVSPVQQNYTQVASVTIGGMGLPLVAAGVAGSLIGIGLVNRFYGQPFFVASHLLMPLAGGLAQGLVPIGAGTIPTFAAAFAGSAAVAIYGLGLTANQGVLTSLASSAGGMAGILGVFVVAGAN